MSGNAAKAMSENDSAVDPAAELVSSRKWLPPLLSVIAGMVDLIGFLTLGNIFTAHITGNLVVASAVLVRGGPIHPAQILAIPVFMVALAALWLIASASRLQGVRLAHLLLWIQLLLIAAVLLVSGIAKPSTNPHGLTAGIVAMIAVSAMACQYAVFRLAIPGAVSTAVMTGNLTNSVLSLMDGLSPDRKLMSVDPDRLRRSLYLLFGFLVGCVVGTAGVVTLHDWAWTLPATLAVVAVALR